MNKNVIKAIIKKELTGYYSTPIGYVFIIIFLFALGYATFEPGKGSFFLLRQADLSSFFLYIPWLFLFLIPAVSMRLWSEERKSGTIELLLTMPVSVKEAVVAKFLAAWLVILSALFLTFPMVLTVFYLGSPDIMSMLVGYMGAIFLAGSFLAFGSFFSALTKNQVISFILSVVTCYVLLMAGSPPILDFLGNVFPGYFLDVFESLSLLNHFEALQRGVLRIGDIYFYLVMIIGPLYACSLVLEEKKAS